MIFARHDFTENFFNAVGYKDEQMENLILIDEIARLIVDDKKSIVEILRKNGINISFKDNPELIKSYLVKEIENGNNSVINFISSRIALNQIDETKLKGIASKYNADANTTKKKTTLGEILSGVISNKDVQSNVIDLISTGVKKVFDKKNPAKTSNDEQLSERLKANQMIQAQDKKKKYIGLKIIGALLLASGIGYGIYYFVKKKSNTTQPLDVVVPPVTPGYTPMSQ
jgi:hypothetical protein